jgi:hypothetical protein
MADLVDRHIIIFLLTRLEIMGILLIVCLLVILYLLLPAIDNSTSRIIYGIEAWKIRQKQKRRKTEDVESIDRRKEEQKQRQIAEATLLIQEAKSAIRRDTYNPFDTDLLLIAIEYYRRSQALVDDNSYLREIDDLQIEIDGRLQFQALFETAVGYFHLKQYRQALSTLFAAQELYSPQRLIKTIAEYQEYINAEDIYFKSLAEARILSYAGKFREALNVVNDAIKKFPHADGESLQFKLSRVIAAKEQLNLGNIEQKIGDPTAAKSHYAAALTLMPEWSDPKSKLAIIETKAGQIDAGIERLSTIDRPEVKYLEGLLYIQRQEYHKAQLVWSKLDLNVVQAHSQILADLAQQESNLARVKIKQLVDGGNLEGARTISLDFIDRFGGDLLVESNLNNCIIPGIESKIWNTQEWSRIALFAREQWLAQRDIKSLHNWAIALYYSTQVDGNIEELIVAWSTAIANINVDPNLQNLPWMGTRSISLIDVSEKLWSLLAQRIEVVKDTDLSKYFYLRDRYRQEFWGVELAKADINDRIVVEKLIIPPGCYQTYYPQISLGKEPQIWRALYTNRGKAVAACLAGDPQRSETIEADLRASFEIEELANYLSCSSLEEFASHFVLYERGCYYLQQENWQIASQLLLEAKSTIDLNDVWSERIEQLCTEYRSKITDFDDNLNFAKFWYELMSSSQSEDYLIEYQALQIQNQWSNPNLSEDEEKRYVVKIQRLLENYPDHPVAQAICTEIQEYYTNIQNKNYANESDEDYLNEYDLIERQALRIQDRWSNSEVGDSISLLKIRQLLDKHPNHPVVFEIYTQIQEYYSNKRNQDRGS